VSTLTAILLPHRAVTEFAAAWQPLDAAV